jgi:hypothetical protein
VPVYDLSKRRRARVVRPHPIFLAFVAVTVLRGRLPATGSATSACSCW